jgi:hypothetical protein
MPTFTPPATDRCPTDYIGGNDRFYPAEQPLRKLLGRYRGELRAPNVYKLTTAAQAIYGGDTYIDDGPTGKGQPYDNPPGSLIAYVYYGSHIYDITTDEAAALTSAGYGAGITP